MSSKKFITVIGPESVISSLCEAQFPDDIQVGLSNPVESLADAVDAPLGPEEIKLFLELVTVAFSAGTALFTFVAKLKSLSATVDMPGTAPLKIHDGRTNQELATIDENTDIQELVELLSSHLKF